MAARGSETAELQKNTHVQDRRWQLTGLWQQCLAEHSEFVGATDAPERCFVVFGNSAARVSADVRVPELCSKLHGAVQCRKVV